MAPHHLRRDLTQVQFPVVPFTVRPIGGGWNLRETADVQETHRPKMATSRRGGLDLTLTKHLLVDKQTLMLFSKDLLFSDTSGISLYISCNTSIQNLVQSCLSAVEAAEGWRLLTYLRKEQLLLWSALQDHGDLSQVGAALPEEALLGAAGWSIQGRPTSTRLHPALDLQAFKSNPNTQISLTHTGVCSTAERVQM